MRFRSLIVTAVLAGTFAPVAWCDTTPTQASADAEGLVKVKVPGLQTVYARPGVNLASYDKVMLDPIAVAFSKNWGSRNPLRRITAEEQQEIKTGLEKILREEFKKELSKSQRYSVVDTPGDDVLKITAEIRDLQINAPDLQEAGITRTYTLSAGEMTLVAELRDSASGALIARVIDRERDPDSPWLQWTTRMDNIIAAQRAAAGWARILRERLDAAHGIGKGS